MVMNHENPPVSITLSPAKVAGIVREASQGRAPSVSTLISKVLAAPLAPEGSARSGPLRRDGQAPEPVFGGYLPRDTEDPRLSRSLLRGLSILTCFGPPAPERRIVALAAALVMSPTTPPPHAPPPSH